MAKITNELEHEVASARIEELLMQVDDNTPENNKYLVELNLLSDLVADYEEEYYPVNRPSLIEVMKLRMYEMKLNQLKLSEILGVSPSRVSEYLTGKSEPTLKVAREISKKLNIDSNIILGV
jgi:HTH-type transcriptional regulator/antitoxin HigA